LFREGKKQAGINTPFFLASKMFLDDYLAMAKVGILTNLNELSCRKIRLLNPKSVKGSPIFILINFKI